MRPEPMPVCGSWNGLAGFGLVDETLSDVIVTTAGEAFLATATIDSLPPTDCGAAFVPPAPLVPLTPVVSPLGVSDVAAGRSRAPDALRARYVPPDARTADTRAALSTRAPADVPRRGDDPRTADVGAGSNHDPGVVPTGPSYRGRDQAGVDSGVGE